jgi:hypothetical protein
MDAFILPAPMALPRMTGLPIPPSAAVHHGLVGVQVQPPPPPPPAAASARQPRRKRTRAPAEELAALISHEDVQAYKLDRAAVGLANELPEAAAFTLLGGELGLAQVPGHDDRRAAILSALRLKGGADGASLGKARRALELLYVYADERGVAEPLPASEVFLNRFLVWVDERATAAARGTQGGSTVRDSVRAGLLLLAAFGCDLRGVKSLVVEAAAPPGKKRHRERRAGSLPIKFYLHFEVLAADSVASPARFYARSFVVAMLFASLRLVDVLRARFVVAPPDADGCPVVMIITSFSKDGSPLDVYERAEGFLGPWAWWPEHMAALAGKSYVLPRFSAPRGHAGDVTADGCALLERVAPKEHAIKSLKALAALPPLACDAATWKAWGITPHSPHGSPADQLAVIGPHAPPDIAATADDEREKCHWRRRALPHGDDRELELEPEVAQLRQPARRGRRPRAAAPAEPADDRSMRVRYTEGTAREGRRRAQLRVCERWVRAVRRGLARFARPWEELPEGRSDYDILADLPAADDAQ